MLLTRKTLTQEHLHSVLEYRNGNFYRKVATKHNTIGSLVKSSFDKEFYEMHGVIGVRGGFRKHRLVWFYFHGAWPDGQIDHIDRNKSNNRIENLRVVKDGENKMNMPMYRNNKTGVCGVHYNKSRTKWVAKITFRKEIFILGVFENFEDAVKARKAAEISFGFSKTHGLKTEQLPPEVVVASNEEL